MQNAAAEAYGQTAVNGLSPREAEAAALDEISQPVAGRQRTMVR